MLRLLVPVLVLLAVVGCGPTKPEPEDAGEPEADAGTQTEDAGAEDSGVTEDAGAEDAGVTPDTFLFTRPPKFSASTSATFTFLGTTGTASYQCNLDDAGYATCVSPVAASNLTEGAHHFAVRALGAEGLTDQTPAEYSWTIDLTPPDTSITSATSGDAGEPRGMVTADCTEPPCSFECALNDAGFSACPAISRWEGLSSGPQSVAVRAKDQAGNADATPAIAEWNVLPGVQTIRVVAANLTSGNGQNYQPEGTRILKALKPDIVLIQELKVGTNTPEEIRAFVDTTFGATFEYVRESTTLPNGVISRYPIRAQGSWDDTLLTEREFVWARIDIPGDRDLWAVSIHLRTSTSGDRNTEAQQLVAHIQANVPAGDLLVVGGDLNTASRTETAVNSLSAIVVTASPYPADQQGNTNTNQNRSSPYDWVLADADLNALKTAVVIGASSFTNGLVFDSRVYSPLSEVPPATFADSGASMMQHMAVVRDFAVPF